jgi:ABC-2 type transport system permease protein
MLWLWHASPVPFGRVLRLKVYSGLIPLLGIALLLTEVTNAMLGVDPVVRWIVRLTIIGLTSGLAALAVAFGVRFPVINPEHAAQVPTSTGGLLFMIAAIAYLAVVMGLEATPMHRYLVATWQHTMMSSSDLWLVGGMLAAALLVQAGVVASSLVWMTRRAASGVLPD